MARPSTAARRYAEAVFEIALRDETLDRWLGELEFAAELISNDNVRRVLDDPARPPDERRAVLERLLAKNTSPSLINLVWLLLQRSRLELVPSVAAQYRRLLNQHRGVVEAVVTSAAPLGPKETAAVSERIVAMTNADVDLREEVDETLIGGLTVRVGDQLLDASVRGRLERLRDRLIAGSR